MCGKKSFFSYIISGRLTIALIVAVEHDFLWFFSFCYSHSLGCFLKTRIAAMGAIAASLFTAVYLLINKGILYCIAALASYVYLKLTRYFFRHRFDNYNFFIDDDAEKLSYYVPKEEFALEYPQKAAHLEKNRDSIFFMGVNSHSESLAVRISRKPNSHVRCSLVLRLSNGRTYVLPDEHIIQKETDEPDTFGTARLKLQCLSPMRRWRIFFNGTLKEESEDGVTEAKHLHVRFSFIWVASSDVFDFSNDMCTSLLTDVVATQSSWRCPPILLLQRLKKIFNSYEQCGMMLGTVTLEGKPEKEVYLWGSRGRYLSGTAAVKEGDFEDIYVNAENGTFIHFGVLNIPGILKNFGYGFVMRPNGFIFPIEKHHVLEEDTLGTFKKYRCFSEGQEYTVQVTKEHVVIKPDGVSSIIQTSALLNIMKGRGIIYQSKIQALKASPQKKQKVLFTAQNELPDTSALLLSLSFDDPYCQIPDITGGKGSSLAKLVAISEEMKNFTVPKGIVVTTSAYQLFIRGSLRNSVRKFQNDAWKMTKDLKTQCQRLVDEISKAELPDIVKSDVEQNLKKVFGSELETAKFAVRSSGTGEDTGQLSAAGQMETFLGCNGLTEILEALKRCWASQFSHIAVEYKRRYGQPLNMPMAVVIQQMIPCDASGVIFTCDPVTGNPSYISITANYGLGESVVGASADPDTVILGRDEYDGITIHSQTTGKKKSKIVMDESGGTREIHIEEGESNEYCISRETAFFLGEIAVKIEEIFGNPRDIEWGTLDGDIYLFQSRPVTSLDIETDFEIKHATDSHLRREDEYSSTANVGEVLPGATSPLGMSLMSRNFQVCCVRQKYVKYEGESLPETPYFIKRATMALSRPFFCVADAFFRFSESEGNEISDHTKATTVAIFGRVVDDKKILDMAKDRHQGSEQAGMSLLGKIYVVLTMFFSGYFVQKSANRLKKLQIPVEKHSSSSEILRTISRSYYNLADVTNVHMECLFSSAFWNNAVVSLLSKAKGGAWDNDVFGDFAYLLSTCTNVESADVPSTIQKMAFAISHCMEPEEFKKMSTQEALEWLQASPSKAGIMFREFLKKHGHRCLKEFDMYILTWGMDPKPLVKILQGMVGKNIKDPEEKTQPSFGEIVAHLNVQLGFLDRLKLRILLPNCQRGVREREFSKSTLIKGYSKFRVAFHALAEAMVREGRLPNKELMFFLDLEELRQLIETRSPRLVAKAFRRWKFHPELDRLIFPEIMSGIPRPINMNEDVAIPGIGFTITGVPVSQGVAKGTARVVLNLEDAHEIQSGDILVTYCTDIGWSPYFVLLSGVATEIGGLISHGAVVAREYGLPCVVNVHGASRAFKSGDQVLLDGNKGTLQKIESP